MRHARLHRWVGEGQSLPHISSSYQVHWNGYQFLTATLQTLCVFLVKFFWGQIQSWPVPYIPHPLFSGRTLSLPCIKSSWLPAALRFAVAFHQSTAVLWLVPPEAKWCKTNLDWLKNAINDLTCHVIHRITSSVPTIWFYIQGIGQGYMERVGLK